MAKYGVGTTRFNVSGPQGFEASFNSPLAGAHNLSNTLSMVSLAHELGLDPVTIQKTLTTFRGVRRRQEVRGEPDGVTVIDDYAHHPTAVADLVLIKEPPGLQSIAPEERLSAAQLVKDISKRGVEAHYFPEVDTMLPFIMSGAKAGDVLLRATDHVHWIL